MVFYLFSSLLYLSFYLYFSWINRINHCPITAPHSPRPTLPLHYSQSGITTDIWLTITATPESSYCYSTATLLLLYSIRMDGWMDGWNENVAISSSVQTTSTPFTQLRILSPSTHHGYRLLRTLTTLLSDGDKKPFLRSLLSIMISSWAFKLSPY